MSRNRFKRDWVPPSKLKKGPNGRNLCRWCFKEVPPRKRTFCSSDCIHEWRLRTDSKYVRQSVFARDKGVCRQCGVDTEAYREALTKLWFKDPKSAHATAWCTGYGNAFKHPTRIWDGIRPRSLWEADHIVEVADGGGETGLENYQTLCLPCHRKKTAESAKKRRKLKAERS